MKVYTIDQVVAEAKKKGFKENEMQPIRDEWNRTQARYESRVDHAGPGLAGAVKYIEECTRACYVASTLCIDRQIDSWQSQGDGSGWHYNN